MLTVEAFTFNPFSENTYLIFNENKECIIIDPGCYLNTEKEELVHFIDSNGLKPICIFLTHSHIDHVFGLDFVKSKYQVPILGHPEAQVRLRSTEVVAKLYGYMIDNPPPIDEFKEEGDTLDLGAHRFKILFCPGHSPDHLVLFAEEEEFAIVGDVIFKESIGRYDLPGGNYETLMESIHQKILVLPSKTVLYSGHGPETTILQEITNNPFLK